MFGAGDRMSGHEMYVPRKVRSHILDDGRFDGADIGHNRAGPEMRSNFSCNSAAGADRNARDHEVGIRHRLGVGGDHVIGNAQFDHALTRRCRARGRCDRADDALCARGARDR